MAVQKDKKSKSCRNMRRSHDHLYMPPMALCSFCGSDKRPHHACGKCGTYNGRAILVTWDERQAKKKAALYSVKNEDSVFETAQEISSTEILTVQHSENTSA